MVSYTHRKQFEKDVPGTLDTIKALGIRDMEFSEKYGKRFALLHLKDLRRGVKGDLSGKTAVENDVALGTGQLNLSAILKAAQKAGVLHYSIEDESPSIATQVPQTIAYLKGLTN